MTAKEFLKQMVKAYGQSCTYILGAYTMATILGLLFKGLRRNPLHRK